MNLRRFRPPLRGLTITLLLIMVSVHVAAGSAQADVVDLTGMSTLENGLGLRLLPDPSTPLVAALALVRTGYASEEPESSGFSHLLEHLVFAGTGKMSREQIQREVEDLGGYINGYTREDYTGYLIVGHRDHLGSFMEILSDILFESAIAASAVEEAREVVLEEIRRARTRPETRESELFQELLYEGSPYARTGLGSETTVRSASREEIVAYYRRSYRPGNMVLLLAGGFETGTALDAVERSFGARPVGASPGRVGSPSPPLASRTYLFESPLPDVRVRMGFAGPDPRSADLEAMELFAAVFGGSDGLLERALKAGGMTPRSASVSLSINSAFTRIVLSAVLPGDADPMSVQRVLLEALPAALGSEQFPERVGEAREALVAQEVLGREKLHYYLMGKAPWVVSASPGQGLSPGRWDDLTAEDVARVAADYFVEKPFTALLTVPRAGREGVRRVRGPVKAEAMLENGLHVVVEQRPASPVFAMHLMTRHRSALEPGGREGIADFLHRLLPLGTFEKDRDQVASLLRRLAVSLSTAGDPTSPFGDFYTSRLYSWIRLECVQENAESASALLAEMVRNPLLGPDEVEEVRGRMLDFLSYRSQSPGTVASGLLAGVLYDGVLGPDVYGSPGSIAAVTREELREFHGSYFTGRNLIISVVSGMPPEESISMVERLFADLPAGERAQVPAIRSTGESRLLEATLGKPQGAYAAGAVTGEVGQDQVPALTVASALLNTRLIEELREKQGLAYSLGASLGEVEGRAVFTFSMGTAPDKIQTARDGLRKQLQAAREAGVRSEDVLREINGLVGRLQMRQMSSINRAYYLGLSTRDSLPHAFGEQYRRMLLDLTTGQIADALKTYLPGDHLVEAVVR